MTCSNDLPMKKVIIRRIGTTAIAGVVAIGLFTASTGQAFSQTAYQASSAPKGCVASSFCKFTFPAPAGKLTISHVSCSVVTTASSSYTGGISYFKLFSSTATSQQDFLQSGLMTYGSNYINQLNESTLYFVSAGAVPQINAYAVTAIAAPNTIDAPTCFISGYVN